MADNYTADVTADETTGKSTLTVKFTDLKTAVANLSAQTMIYVEYTAKLDPKKDANIVVGGNGNENTVKLVYSNNPMAEGTGTSVPDTCATTPTRSSSSRRILPRKPLSSRE